MSKRRARRDQPPPAWLRFGTIPENIPTDPIEFAKFFRHECSQCGSTNIRWTSGRELNAENPQGLEDLAPPDEPFGNLMGGAVWMCEDCDGGGIFLPPG